jgi:protein gp37
MSLKSTIEWTMTTWNPVVGCTKITSGCAHCYAERMAAGLKKIALARIAAGKQPGRARYYIDAIDEHGHWSGKLVPVPEALRDPFTWAKPQVVFVNSMSDLFHESVPTEFVGQIVRVMAETPWHTYQVLTKRGDRLQSLLAGELVEFAHQPNIWWGVSVENRKQGLPRVDLLRSSPAAARFLSVEPLLEDLGQVNLDGIHWVIVGGESGPKARAIEEDWVVSIRDQCRAVHIPFFFKQWGGVQKSKTGRSLEGRIYNEMPVWHMQPVPPLEKRRAMKSRWARAIATADPSTLP